MRIAIAADHNAVSMKSRLAAWLTQRGHQIDDRGVHDADEVADYPPLCADVGSQVGSTAPTTSASSSAEAAAVNR